VFCNQTHIVGVDAWNTLQELFRKHLAEVLVTLSLLPFSIFIRVVDVESLDRLVESFCISNLANFLNLHEIWVSLSTREMSLKVHENLSCVSWTLAPDDLEVGEVKSQQSDLGNNTLGTDLLTCDALLLLILQLEGNVLVKFNQEAGLLIKLVHHGNLLEKTSTLETLKEITRSYSLPFDGDLIAQDVVTDGEHERNDPEASLVKKNRSHAGELSAVHGNDVPLTFHVNLIDLAVMKHALRKCSLCIHLLTSLIWINNLGLYFNSVFEEKLHGSFLFFENVHILELFSAMVIHHHVHL